MQGPVAFLVVLLLLPGLVPAPGGAQIPVHDGPGPDVAGQYGASALQSGGLRLPDGEGPFPVAVTIHGGCWLDRLGQGSLTPVAAALPESGVATWDVTYRRLGHEGGGWPGTFLDVGAAVDHLRILAEDHPIDLDRVVLVGHSSGAHLAVWAAGRPGLAPESEIRGADPLPVRAVVAVDGPVDLAGWHDAGLDRRVCGEPVISSLLGGGPDAVPARYAQASPAQMPAMAPEIFLTPGGMMLAMGDQDVMTRRARRTGERVHVVPVPDSDHFQLITPSEAAWEPVRATILRSLGMAADPRLPVPGARRSDTGIAETEYAARREALAERMGRGAVLAYGATYPTDYDFAFRQLPAFDYLTGFREPDAAMVLVHEDDRVSLSLFTDRPTVREQLYDGFRESPASLATRTGATVRRLDEFAAVADSLAGTGLPLFHLRDFASADAAARDTLTRGRELMEVLRERHPGVELVDLHPEVDRLRARKSEAEIALLREAVALTDRAHRRVLGLIEPGVREYEVEAAVLETFRAGGGDGAAYTSIVGSGLNATVLHYVRNDRQMEAGDLVLMDIGAQVAGYAADITRTVPVSGTFTPEQRDVYEIVLDAVKAAEGAARPGGPAVASLAAATRTRLDGMAELGLIQDPGATYDPPWPVDCEARPDQCLQGMLFMIHGISHGIGLEVHDPASFYHDRGRYSPGDVFTIEPGIYVNARVLELLPDTERNRAFVAAVGDAVERYHGIGVRVEDDYLMTEDGLVRLSDAPREMDAVEAAMRSAGGAATGVDASSADGPGR